MCAAKPPNVPTGPDAVAAHKFLTEILTRVATQRLHFSEGDEKVALDSLYELFGLARKTISDNVGCTEFSEVTVAFLNGDFRAFMAKWHRKRLAGELDTRDGAVEFRTALRGIQDEFRAFAKVLHKMAHGPDLPDFPPDRNDKAFPDAPLVFGIPKNPKEGMVPQEHGDRNPIHIVDRINASEAEAITKRRARFTPPPPDEDKGPLTDVAGLALSGGGIRSASFSLGVAQVLAKHSKIMNSIDLMSTVSGGGFTGAFLSRRIADGGTEAVANPEGPDTEAVRYLRQRANYLTTGNAMITLGLMFNLLAGMILNWTAPAALIAVLVSVMHLLEVFDLPAMALGLLASVCLAVTATTLLMAPYSLGRVRDFGIWFFSLSAGGLLAMLLFKFDYQNLVLFSAVSAGVAFVTYAWLPYSLGRLRLGAMWFFSLAAAFLLALFLVDQGYQLFETMVENEWAVTSASLATVAAALPAISRVLPMLGQAWVRMIGNRIVMTIASIAVPLLALMAGYALYYLGTSTEFGVPMAFLDAQIKPGLTVVLIIAAGLVVTALGVININATGPHWLYRQQLANTFVRLDQNGSTDVPLSDLDPEQKAPYLLLNAVVNLPNSERIEMRERRGDFFVFSKNWCGSPVTGYRPTGHWLRWPKTKLDLATAVATSGAAVAPHMALLSMSSARALLSFLNIRLGFWVRRPSLDQTGPVGTGGRPGAWMLLREMLGFAMDEKREWMMLTDGAHLENSAIYELLRRRCKFIVAVDASAEKDGSFRTILTLVRHAGVDFGVRIHTDLKELRADPETGLSRAHGGLCEIDYPGVDGQPAGKGLLLIMKLSMTGNESELVNAYRHANPAFPNVSTADQFFDEHQFEAFRQLGAHAAQSMLEPALVGDGGEVSSVADWLTRLYQRIPPDLDR
ncbi:patatin-like phospholipase family protein [uncultured Tateyamaria sp.]|uniref:patatin-like phospholipase family protein n=1 Tax=uncultured Tateyamaria sp. TaxID=455651 RepID=UPI002628CA12|nr:patatin-like phospholipase family protein [uncultured Tateyamaria sp.]